MEIKYYQKLRNINRLSMMFTFRNYNLMEHQYMVAMLFRKFASLEDVAYDINVLDLVLHHDIVETVTSDLPWPVKNFSMETKAAWEVIEDKITDHHFQLEKYSDHNLKMGMTKRQYDLFKVCDVLDLLIFVREERKLGNNSEDIIEVEDNCFKIFDSIETRFPHIKEYIITL